MEWIVTTARTVEEAQIRALDLLGVDQDDAEIQVIEEGKTGLFGRTKSEARVRARIKPKAPPVKDERRGGGRNDRNRNRNRGGGSGGGGNNRNRNRGGGGNKGGNGDRNRGGNNAGGNNAGGNNGGKKDSQKSGGNNQDRAGGGDNGGQGRNRNQGNQGGNRGGGGNNRNRNRNRGGQGGNNEDRVEMPIEEQRETLLAFVQGVAEVFDSNATVNLTEEDTTLLASVEGEDLGRLIGNKASTLQTVEELARTAMHRAAAGRRYHRIQVDVDGYRARRREALARFAQQVAESVVDSGESKALEPMGAADRKLVHDAVSQVAGVETVSEGRDPRRYIVIAPIAGGDEEE
ncbi:MAG: RNA-binding cell elongation regulator Jag/EloR [Actinomycetota bacterium]